MAPTVSFTYDDDRGRVRITASGFASSVVRATVFSKASTESVFSEVRGGKVPVTLNAFALPVDDFEFAAGDTTLYKVVGYSSPNDTSAVEEVTVSRADSLDQVWLKFIAAPFLNRKITLTGWGDIQRSARNGIFQVTGRRDPVVVTDLHTSRSVEISVRTLTIAETTALDLALSNGQTVFLHVPLTCPLPSMYAAVGNFSYSRPASRSLVSNFKLPLTEVAKPTLAVTAAVNTWAGLKSKYGTWADLRSSAPTWQAVVA